MKELLPIPHHFTTFTMMFEGKMTSTGDGGAALPPRRQLNVFVNSISTIGLNIISAYTVMSGAGAPS